jgi:hypothetical protein
MLFILPHPTTFRVSRRIVPLGRANISLPLKNDPGLVFVSVSLDVPRRREERSVINRTGNNQPK